MATFASLEEFNAFVNNLGPRATNRAAQNRNASYEATVQAIYDVNATVAQLANEVRGAIGTVVENTIDALDVAVKNRPTQLKKVYETLAKQGQEAILAAYDEHYSAAPKYRWNDQGKWRRYSNGALRTALASPNLYRVGPDGIDFILGDYLDSKAKQWYRLNFGAAPRGSEHHAATLISMFGEEIPGIELADFGPSRGFTIPYGFWSAEVLGSSPTGRLPQPGSTAFYPLGAMNQNQRSQHRKLTRGGQSQDGFIRKTLTQGILGTRYLDAGTDRINSELGPAVENLVSGWLNEAKFGRPLASGGFGRKSGLLAPAVAQLSDRQFKKIQSSLSNL